MARDPCRYRPTSGRRRPRPPRPGAAPRCGSPRGHGRPRRPARRDRHRPMRPATRPPSGRAGAVSRNAQSGRRPCRSRRRPRARRGGRWRWGRPRWGPPRPARPAPPASRWVGGAGQDPGDVLGVEQHRPGGAATAGWWSTRPGSIRPATPWCSTSQPGRRSGRVPPPSLASSQGRSGRATSRWSRRPVSRTGSASTSLAGANDTHMPGRGSARAGRRALPLGRVGPGQVPHGPVQQGERRLSVGAGHRLGEQQRVLVQVQVEVGRQAEVEGGEAQPLPVLQVGRGPGRPAAPAAPSRCRS